MTTLFKLFIQVIQDYVRQEWRKRTALGNPYGGCLKTTLYHDPGPQVLSDQAQDALVSNFARQTVHEHVALDGVEKLG